MTEDFKLPRLYTPDQNYSVGASFTLSPDQAHYLRNVMRTKEGQNIRVFNSKDGEWLASLTTQGKKAAELTLSKRLKPQPTDTGRTHLLFAPIKKNRMDILIEKAVELGVTDFHPLLTQNTEVRKINTKRLNAQIIEAAEQCERFAIPTLHSDETPPTLDKILSNWDSGTIHAALERHDAPHIKDISFDKDKTFLIGPAGGFTAEEKNMLSTHDKIQPISLGDTIYRVETAALFCLIKSS
jgi:16S rRNA (uracil1498-N3)-methyltransferase